MQTGAPASLNVMLQAISDVLKQKTSGLLIHHLGIKKGENNTLQMGFQNCQALSSSFPGSAGVYHCDTRKGITQLIVKMVIGDKFPISFVVRERWRRFCSQSAR